MAESSPSTCFKGGKFSAPGFRFHPTDEELVVYYLKRRICGRRLRANVIGVVDVYKMDPEELPGQSLLKTGDRMWFFFTPRSRKYPNAARSSRGTATGYWKATGKDRTIEYNTRAVGLKKTLVFYRGRAPDGQRTDWVMHEYTMNEEELDRCKNVKDYYALYKLFKKSGAGPKNGEQYGAPFHEEEWADDDSEDADNVVVPEDPVVRYEENRHVDDGIHLNPASVQLDDLEKLLFDIPDAPEVPPRRTNELASGLSHVNSEEEVQSTLVNSSAEEFFAPREIGEFLPNDQPYHRLSSFESLVSTNSSEAIATSSAPKNSSIGPLVFEKEDYIEIDDLLISDLGTEKPAEFWNPPGEFDNLNEFDQLFHDVSMSLDMDPVFQGTSTDPSSLRNFANNSPDQRQQQFFNQQFQDPILENQLNNFMDPSTALNQIGDNTWFEDSQADFFGQPQSSSEPFASSSGVIPESTNPTLSVNTQDQEGQNGHGTTSQFSSALWAFMDSIPSTPASACEGPLNRTFVRMSSFSRMRFSGKGNGTEVGNTNVTIAKKRSRNRGFLLLSIMGALCAIFGVFIATLQTSWRPVFS